jgi:multisubunit Na+/H+ antiporter MnhF subunit
LLIKGDPVIAADTVTGVAEGATVILAIEVGETMLFDILVV